ncbi:MAG: hypothetical protein AAGI53_02550 [Planctomycetota bacterium]
MKNSIIIVAGFAAAASAQSVATYSMTATPNPANLGDTVLFEVMGSATAGQIGNASGIGGVNLSVDIAGGSVDLGSVTSNGEVFGGTNVVADAGGFDISFAANSFVGNNFTDGIVLFSFEVAADQVGTMTVSTSQGVVSVFGAAIGLPGAFQPSLNYDTVEFASASVSVVPTPGAAAVLGLGGLAIARRRR